MKPGACLLATAPRQVMSGPAFDGLAQPALADAGEREPAVMTQDSQIPPVFGDLSARVGEGPPEVGKQRVDQRPPHRLVLDGQLRQRGHLRLAPRPDQTAQEPAAAPAPPPPPPL